MNIKLNKQTLPQHFVFVLVERFTHLALTCAVEPLRLANLLSDQQLYRWSYASSNGQSEIGSDGSVLQTHHKFSDLPECDLLFVLGGMDIQKRDHQALAAILRREERLRGTRIGTLCSGSYVLAKTGLLDGHATTIHWEYHDGFIEDFPEVELLSNVFLADTKYISASGGDWISGLNVTPNRARSRVRLGLCRCRSNAV